MIRVWSWVRKEWGDHRPILLGIAIAIPALTLLAFWGFGNAMRGATPETVGGIFALGLLVLLWFGVASDLVATDVRRGTLSAIRRTPRGLGAAWIGKLAFLVLAVAALAIWTALTLQGAWALFVGDNGLLQVGPGLAPAFWLTLAMGAPLLSWPLLTGTWIGRSGAAGLGGILVLGAFAGPAWLWWRAYEYVYPVERIEAVQSIALLVGIAGFVLATISFLVGHRHRGRAWRPFLIGGSGLAVLLVAGFAWGSWKAHRWTQLDPADPDLSIYAARVAAGEQKLWVSVHRGAPWLGGKPMFANHENKAGTPVQTWIVDLPTKRVTRVDDGAESLVCSLNRLYRQYHNRGFESLEPDVALWTYRWSPEGSSGIEQITWWDASAGESVATLSPLVRNGATDELMQRALRQSTPHRDDQGRRVWMRNGVFEREGEERAPAERTYRWSNRDEKALVPGGWFSARLGPDRRGRPSDVHVALVDLEGSETFASLPRIRLVYPGSVLSMDHWISRRSDPDKPGKLLRRSAVRSFLDPEREVPIESPLAATVVGIDQVLCCSAEPGDAALVLVNPLTGAERVLAWEGARPERVDGTRVHGRRSDGRLLVGISHFKPDNRSTYRFAVVDLTTEAVTLVGGEVSAARSECYPIALLEDGSVVILEGKQSRGGRMRGKRIVRLGPGVAGRTVLFPFAD